MYIAIVSSRETWAYCQFVSLLVEFLSLLVEFWYYMQFKFNLRKTKAMQANNIYTKPMFVSEKGSKVDIIDCM